MDLSKNEPKQPDQNPVPTPPAGPDYTPQNGYTAPQSPQDPQGSQSHLQHPYNGPQQAQVYPNQQFPQGYQHPQNPVYPPQNPYGQPQQYGAPQFQGQPQQYGYPQQSYGYPPVVNLAEKEAKTSWILGLIGIFIMGLVLGTIGLIKASKARSMGADATAGFILSTMAVISHVGWLLFFAILGGDPSSGY